MWHLGYPDQALAGRVERCSSWLAAIGHPFSLAYAFAITGLSCTIHCRLGAEAEAGADEQIDIATEQGFAFWHATGLLCKGGGILLQGRLEEALPLLVKGLELPIAAPAPVSSLPTYLSILGDAYTQAGRFDEGARGAGRRAGHREKNDDRSQEAELHRLKGELHLAETNDQAAAEECFHTAIETARRQQSKAWELRATMSLARLWQRQGRRDEARDALAAVYGTYTEGFTTPDLVDAKALLESLAEPI